MKPKALAIVPKVETCGSCRFYEARTFDPAARPGYVSSAGWCRRYPANEQKMPGDWCGEYKEKA